MVNVRFYTLNALPTWVDSTCQGAFINLTAKSGDNEPGLYFGTNTGWVRLDNIAQDTASEIHSASVNTETGVVSFFNSNDKSGDALFTLTLADYISAEIAKLATENDVVIATNTDGVVKIKAGVKEECGVIAQGDGEDITLAKVATTGKAEDITFNAINLEGVDESENPVVAQGATLQNVIEGVEDQMAKLAGEIDDLENASKLTLKTADGTTATEVKADGSTYKLYQGETPVCSFNIEKDSFVREGSVVYGSLSDDGVFTENTTTGEAFIKLVIRENDEADVNTDKEIYIAASSLIDQIKVKANDGVEDAEDGTQNHSTAYLTYDSDTNSLVITNKVKQAIALAETSVQSVNGHSAEEDGTVTIKASDIETKFEGEDGEKLTIDDKFDAVDKAIEDAISSGVNAAKVTESNNTDAELGFITADVVPNDDEDATAGKKVTIDVKYGKFAQDENGNLPIDEEDTVVNGVEGIATIAEVGRVITANEAVTAAALNDLNERIGDATEYDEDNKVTKDGTGLTKRVEDLEKRNKEFDPVVTTVEADEEVTGIKITVADNTEEGDNDHKYAVKAELVWLTDFPTQDPQ